MLLVLLTYQVYSYKFKSLRMLISNGYAATPSSSRYASNVNGFLYLCVMMWTWTIKIFLSIPNLLFLPSACLFAFTDYWTIFKYILVITSKRIPSQTLVPEPERTGLNINCMVPGSQGKLNIINIIFKKWKHWIFPCISRNLMDITDI